MPAELILDYLSSSSAWEQLCFQVVFQCAPVLKGVKASNLITLPKGMWLHLFNILKDTDISCKILYSGSKNEVIFLYREDRLNEILEDRKAWDFVQSCGYAEMGMSEILKRLRSRYELFMRKTGDFPHELGIFLQYPIEDVKAFIQNGGKNSLLSGYWKVYHNPMQAAQIFRTYDEVRDHAASEFMKHKSIRQVVC
ncbi:DUF3793 family protein [uncultured Robinsoniella sp.]|uniref:DUF3793 family protein n=1 Tax=uncultured Robinsoniella sp. TaxID=904190 RepID=UPI00374F17F3